jgi:uncharacterized membrane protein
MYRSPRAAASASHAMAASMRTWLLAIALLLAACGRATEAPRQNSIADPGQPPAAPADPASPKGTRSANVSPCLIQDGTRIADNRLHAIGTEPFWAADVEGRCVTYSTPENQKGTRVWTKFSGSAEQGRWSGALDGRPFVLSTRAQSGCSDGMSDNRYPIAVALTVGGEQRSGCAEPRP